MTAWATSGILTKIFANFMLNDFAFYAFSWAKMFGVLRSGPADVTIQSHGSIHLSSTS